MPLLPERKDLNSSVTISSQNTTTKRQNEHHRKTMLKVMDPNVH